uniref:Uncharacterized mitochondrial protein AtMg00810-like n=1 Tax=Tanacetum cinerariifolium TaxID=118510 RepID=A0A6L2M8C7_TANCI|nr:uncharacterized mitochondrial protein AtMg00810-like [Tanacetum cinerariifolium]
MVRGIRGNQFRQYAGQNARNQIGYNAEKTVKNRYGFNVVQNVGNQNRNSNVVAARAEGNGNGNNGKQISSCHDLDGSAEVHQYENCYINEIFNMFTQDVQYTELLESTTEPHLVKQNNSDTFSPSVVRKFQIEVKDTIMTLQRVVKSRMLLNVNNWPSPVHQKIHKVFKDECAAIVNQVHVRVIHFEKEFLKESVKFVRDFKSLTKEVDESLDKITVLEKENERLLRAVVSQDIMSIVQNLSVVDTSNLQTELEHHPSHVYKLKKALYGLKQALMTWYDELSKFLLQNHFTKGTADPTLFKIRYNNDILVTQPIEKHLKEVKRIFRYLWGIINIGLWYMKDSGFELIGFSDADHKGCQDIFKSTSRGTQLLGEKLTSRHGPNDAMHNPPSYSGFSQKKFVSFLMEINTLLSAFSLQDR